MGEITIRQPQAKIELKLGHNRSQARTVVQPCGELFDRNSWAENF